ncbi:MAG: Holliday junction ATP-dependent DNA helicase RuvA [Ignavibacteriae bacterium]|nr:Holliday junction ATP-dependent DNA helicase RuvA [Ignavibacteriota bacterium]
MITSIKGKLVFKGVNDVVIEVSGIGYSVYVSKRVMENLPELNEEFYISTLLDVKENSLTLYGFHNEREREIFKLLVTVNGISAKSAHTILSHASFEDIIGLITSKDSFAVKIPGIGSRKIEMISLALKDKIFKITETGGAGAQYLPLSGGNEQARLEALHALMNLGYSRNDGEKIIREVLKSAPCIEFTTEELIRKSLDFIS